MNPQSSQLGAQTIALGGEGQGAREVVCISGLSPVGSEQLVGFLWCQRGRKNTFVKSHFSVRNAPHPENQADAPFSWVEMF